MELERDIQHKVQALATQDPFNWTEGQIDSLMAPLEFTRSSGVPLKPVFRSSYPYQQPDPVRFQQTDTQCVVSHAKGGLSAVWGGHVMPCAAAQIRHWPVSNEDLDAGYAAAARMIKPTRLKDDDAMDDYFPMPYGYTHNHNLTAQGELLFQKAVKYKAQSKNRAL